MGFKVPDDLADLDLTLTEVKRILDNRKGRKRTQTRLDGLPDKAKGYKADLAAFDKTEADLLAKADERAKADAARAATASEGSTNPKGNNPKSNMLDKAKAEIQGK